VLYGDFRFEGRAGDRRTPLRLARVRRITEPDAVFSNRPAATRRRRFSASPPLCAPRWASAFRCPATALRELVKRRHDGRAGESHRERPRRAGLAQATRLSRDLPERARSLLSILRSRQRVLDLLRPYQRHLSSARELN
jgi:hypothetical protein